MMFAGNIQAFAIFLPYFVKFIKNILLAANKSQINIKKLVCEICCHCYMPPLLYAATAICRHCYMHVAIVKC